MSVSLRPQNKQLWMKDWKKRRREPGGENCVSSEKHEFLPTKLQKWFFFVTMECRNLFCFWNQRKWDSKEEIFTTESTNKDFDHEKEIICYHSCQRKESVSLCWKEVETKEYFRKYVTQNVRRKEGSGDETSLIGVCAQVEVHTHNTIFTTHEIWFFTTLSGCLHQVFFSFVWWEKASASRQG